MPPYVDAGKFSGSVHGGNGCVSCHVDTQETPHPGKLKPVDCAQCHDKASASYTASVHGIARRAGNLKAAQCADCHGMHDIARRSDPASPMHRENLAATCAKCHAEIVEEVKESVHGQAMAQGIHEAPTCTDCHSDHAIEGLRNASSIKLAEEICSRCHASQRMNTKFGLPPNRVATFFESYHGLALRMGSTKAANCASCHGFHNILPASDPRSSVNKANLMRTCQKCHPGASENFSLGRVHADEQVVTDIGSRINWWARRLYVVLIFGTIGGMLLHNFLSLRRRALAALKDPNRTVVRMRRAHRVQHTLLVVSFVYLAVSGFALKYPDSWLGYAMGSSEAFRRLSHRLAAVLMIVLSMGHVLYVIWTQDGRGFIRDIFPGKKDLQDVGANFRYFLRHGTPRPRFGRFGYMEKAEYWAVVWGTIIMSGTGLMIWFKLAFTQWLPRWAVEVATTVHYYEAILACLSILVWHFFFVMFDPDVYPVNWAWLDGRVYPEHGPEEEPSAEAEDETKQPPGA